MPSEALRTCTSMGFQEHRKGNLEKNGWNVEAAVSLFLVVVVGWWWHSHIVELLQRRAFDLVFCFGEHQYQKMVLPRMHTVQSN